MTDKLLDVRGWVGERDGRLLWGPLDVALSPGDALHVQGPNGCGKTTLLRTLAGLRPPASATHTQLCSDVWWVGHAGGLSEELSALQNLALRLAAGAAPGLAQATLRAHLSAQGIAPGQPARLLSAGQRRKLMLAPLALAPRTLWLLDEPFDALDTAACQGLAELAAQHLARGGALVLTSHQQLPPEFPRHRALHLGAARTRAAAISDQQAI